MGDQLSYLSFFLFRVNFNQTSHFCDSEAISSSRPILRFMKTSCFEQEFKLSLICYLSCCLSLHHCRSQARIRRRLATLSHKKHPVTETLTSITQEFFVLERGEFSLRRRMTTLLVIRAINVVTWQENTGHVSRRKDYLSSSGDYNLLLLRISKARWT